MSPPRGRGPGPAPWSGLGGRFSVILAGTGSSALAAFLGLHLLRDQGHHQVDLALGGGSLGFEPFDSNMSDFEHLRSARALGDAWDVAPVPGPVSWCSRTRKAGPTRSAPTSSPTS